MSDTIDGTPHPFDVVVAGAGLAGLASAATAARRGARVLLLDAHAPGGRARTDDRRGYLFNQGPHALYDGGPAERVLRDLGIDLTGGRPSTKVWGVAGDVVSPLPFSAGGAVRSRLVSPAGKAQLGRFVLQLRSLDPTPLADRSAEQWIAGLRLRGGAAEVVRTLARVSSYADDLAAISADAVASQLQRAVVDGVRYLDGGWQPMVDALVDAATGAGTTLVRGATVVAVEPGEHGLQVRIRRQGDGAGPGPDVVAGAVVLAVGGPAATAKVLREPPRWGLIGPPATAACLDLGLRRRPDKPVLFGVGEPLYLSTHTPSAALAPTGGTVVHAMRYGARDAATDRAELWEHARLAGIGEDDVAEQRFLARMIVTHAVPVPGSGLAGRPSVDAAAVPGVYLAGDWVGPEGLLADGALASGVTAGTRAADHARARPVAA